MIVASQAHQKSSATEVIVLQIVDDVITWKATSITPQRDGDGIGKVNRSNEDFAGIFKEVLDAKSPQPSLPVSDSHLRPFYNLVIIDSKGARATASLNNTQVLILKRRLKAVCDDIARNGPYAKINIMLDIVTPEGAIREVQDP